MKRAIFSLALMCSILFAGQVTAETWIEQVTPKKTRQTWRHLHKSKSSGSSRDRARRSSRSTSR